MSFSFSSASRRSPYLAAVGRIDAGVDHGLHGLVAGQRLAAGVLHACDRVADARVRHGLDGGRQIADLARAESIGRDHAVRVQVADLDDLVFRARGHHADVHAGAQHAVLHAADRRSRRGRSRTDCRRSEPAAGASRSPCGAGMFRTTSSSTAWMLMPFLAEISGASMAGMPMTSSISCLTSSGSARTAGRSCSPRG